MSPIAVRIATNNGEKIVFANNSYLKLINIQERELLNKNPKTYYIHESIYKDILNSLERNERIENKLISLLKTQKKDDSFLMKWVAVGLSYFHNQPSYVITRISETDVSLDNENMIAVKIADKLLWLPHWNNNMGTEINQDGENSITLR